MLTCNEWLMHRSIRSFDTPPPAPPVTHGRRGIYDFKGKESAFEWLRKTILHRRGMMYRSEKPKSNTKN